MPLEPHETLWALSTAMIPARTLQVIAELGVADHIDDRPVPADELARACHADADGLERALRLLAANGIFECSRVGVGHNAASRLLRSDHPTSMRSFPRMMGIPAFTASVGRLEHSIRTGSPAFDLVDPDGLFAYLQRHPDEARIFDQSMTSKAGADIAAVLATYDFRGFDTIADIGGGRGHLLRAVLETAPRAQGLLFDLPAVIDSIDTNVDRLTLQPGDFFTDTLPNADAYILMEVIHDWDDAAAKAILSAVRAAASPGATILIIETAPDDGQLDARVQTLDMIMLTITGGRERSFGELGQLLEGAGMRAVEVHHTPGAVRIVEATAV
jgi:hypothetical protein